MNILSKPASLIDIDAPLTNFVQCHEGIVTKLQAFAGLPALMDAVAQARKIATDTVALFDNVVLEHHLEEERDLFPAVLRSAAPGPERERVQIAVDRLTAEHRMVEAAWRRLEPALRAVAKGKPAELEMTAVQALTSTYVAHAQYEEREFLPLCETILGRDGNHMAALGLSLHMRHVQPMSGYI